jgi:2-keto-4-pentenoate hydratase/2-oxohepta-3-ene-1,7-dioic acid hydratase in catechol pathway
VLRLVRFAHAGELGVGAVDDDHVIDLNRADPELPRELHELIAGGGPLLSLARRTIDRVLGASQEVRDELVGNGTLVARGDVQLLAPVPPPRRNVFCVGRNYMEHVAEGARILGPDFKPAEHPEYFTKPPDSIVGPDARFMLDEAVTRELDYEVELAVVIGRRGRTIPQQRAYEYVFGYAIGNDISARDQQKRHGQWFKGKGLDRSCPLGPFLVPHADVGDPHELAIRLCVNGEDRQRANTKDMMWRVPDIIHWLSCGTSLEPGDVILTGTPNGVGVAMSPPAFLRPGDVVEAEIQGLGRLRTHIVGRRR